MIFEDYVNIVSNILTDEQLTKTEILAELQHGPIPDLEEEEEEAEEANATEPNVCSLADDSYHSIFFS